MSAGWIKLHRQIINHPTFKKPELLRVWIWLLCNVTHAPIKAHFGGKEIELRPGQMTCGRRQIAEALGISEWKVYRHLRCLKIAQQIAVSTSNACSLVTITNWSEYQVAMNENAQQTHTKQEDIYTELPPRFPRTPEEAVAACAPAGIPNDFVVQVWNKAMGRGGRDASDCPVRNFIFYAKTEWGYELNRREKEKRTSTRQQPASDTSKPIVVRWQDAIG